MEIQPGTGMVTEVGTVMPISACWDRPHTAWVHRAARRDPYGTRVGKRGVPPSISPSTLLGAAG